MRFKILFLFVAFLYSPEKPMTCKFTFYNSYYVVDSRFFFNLKPNEKGLLVDGNGEVIRRGQFYFIPKISNTICVFFCLDDDSKIRKLTDSLSPISYSIVDGKIVSNSRLTSSIPPCEAVSLNLDIVDSFVLDKWNPSIFRLNQCRLEMTQDSRIFMGRGFRIVDGKYYQAETQVPFDGFLFKGKFACYEDPSFYNKYIGLDKNVTVKRITNGELSTKDIQDETIRRQETSIVELDSVNQIMSLIIDGKEIETQIIIKDGFYVDNEGNRIKEGSIIFGQFFVINGIIYSDPMKATLSCRVINGVAEIFGQMRGFKEEKRKVIQFDSVLCHNGIYSGYMKVDGKIHLNPLNQVKEGLMAQGVFYSYDQYESSKIFAPEGQEIKFLKIKNGLTSDNSEYLD